MSAVPFGPFALHRRIGSGGRGVVWAGSHLASGAPVAVKVLRPRGASDWETFEDEIRAVAGLHHPAVVTVYDHGRVSADAQLASGGELAEGSPFLAMELGAGTLADRPALRWEELSATLRAILSALAHAHARGLLHLDVKPENVLVGCGEGGFAQGLRLADFGLARPTGDGDRPISGTPAFMAPEQATRGGELGPWTDLYAVGCVAWELCCGAPVFDGDVRAVLSAHRSRAPGPFHAVAPVPEGFEVWVRGLLEKAPGARPAFAADALAALDRLAGPVVGGGATAVGRVGPTATFGWDDDATLTDASGPEQASVDALPLDAPSGPHAGVETAGFGPPGFPPVPPAASSGHRVRLLDVGLGLFPYRRLPLLGWAETRGALWAALGDAQRGIVRVLLTGSEDGVERVARWLAEAAHEHGAARIATPDDRSPREAAEALADADRPVLLVGEGPEVEPLGRALSALAVFRPVRALWVRTRGDPAPGERALALPEQPEPEIRRLLREVLDLEPTLADLVVEGAGGDPDLAVAMVGDLARDGGLTPTPDGYALAEGAALGPPDGLVERWERRVHALDPDPDGPTWRLLERVAAFGRPFPAWEALGLRPGPEAATVARAGLVRRRGGAWELAPAAVGEAVVAHARARGRHDALHQALLASGGDDAQRGRWLLALGRAEEAIEPLRDQLVVRWQRRVATLADCAVFEAALEAADVPPSHLDWGLLRTHELWLRRNRRRAGVVAPALALAADADRWGWEPVRLLARRVAARSMGQVPACRALHQRILDDAIASRSSRTAMAANDFASFLLGLGWLAEARDLLALAISHAREEEPGSWVLPRMNLASDAAEQGEPGHPPPSLAEISQLDLTLAERCRGKIGVALWSRGERAEARRVLQAVASESRAAGRWQNTAFAEATLAEHDLAEGRPEVAREGARLAGELCDAVDQEPPVELLRVWLALGETGRVAERLAEVEPDDLPVVRWLHAALSGGPAEVEAAFERWRAGEASVTVPWMPLVLRAVRRLRVEGHGVLTDAWLADQGARWAAHGQRRELELAREARLASG